MSELGSISSRLIEDEAYAFEELVAELTASFVCANMGIKSESRKDHAKYIKSWLGILKNDKNAIITAGSQASKAAMFILPEERESASTVAA